MRRAPRKTVVESTTTMLDRSRTAPLCVTCGYRVSAIDRCRAACRHCGEIVHVQRWIVGHLINVFGGRLVWVFD